MGGGVESEFSVMLLPSPSQSKVQFLSPPKIKSDRTLQSSVLVWVRLSQCSRLGWSCDGEAESG